MDNMDMKANGSSVWPYVVVGSAIGGALGYLLMSESGRRVRHSVTHPDDLANSVEKAGDFLERKAKVVTDQVHGVIQKAKRSIDEGERAYHDAAQQYRSRARQIETKNDEITANVHTTVERMSRTAMAVEQSVLDPICELGALYRGVERGVRSLLGKSARPMIEDGPVPIRDHRVMGN